MPRRNKNGSRGRTKSHRLPEHEDKSRKKSHSKKARKQKREEQRPALGAAQPNAQQSSQAPKGKRKIPAQSPSPISMVSPRKSPNVALPNEVDGFIDIHPDGFGFLIPFDSSLPNIYVVEESLKKAMNRDRIRVNVFQQASGDTKARAKMVEILARHSKELFAVYRPFRGGALIVPADARNRHHAFKVVNMDAEMVKKLKPGATVLAKILTYPDLGPGTAEITENIEVLNSPSNDTLRVLIEAAWPREFTKGAIDDAEGRAKTFERNPTAIDHRRDITNLPLVTIDGRDARDFDDAVCAERMGQNRHKLWVAIADVSHFVVAGAQLDKEAFERSTSVYFPDFVVPMLPEVLSNGVCSLNPHVPRNCLVAEMVIDASGQLESYEMYEGLMKSHKRLTYDDMQAYMDSDALMREDLKSLTPSLDALTEVFHKLRKARFARGSVELDLPEALVQLNSAGEVTDIQTRTRTDSHKLIEECMLVANAAAAKFLKKSADIGVYRIHEQPEERKIQALKDFLELNAIDFDAAFESSQDFANLTEFLQKNDGLDDSLRRAAQMLVLRSFQQARYAPVPLGHFALASPDYTHFTSPIRRYPDLMVHRLVKHHLGIQKYPGPADLDYATRYCSEQERKAMDAERKLIDMKKCRFMEPHLGEDFKVWVSGITERGVFCQIEDHFVDGFIKSVELQRAFRMKFDAATMTYRGPDQMVLKLGTKLLIRVAMVDVEARKIDFEPVEMF
ncbi:MAG TPA: ribonuclease R [Bdellovibrionota bacterium]|jgi:ribonuclease R|nr:ribonuclease R [Bdellovibrionota bacterium]